MTDEKTELYRFTSVKTHGDGTTKIVLEGTPEEPKRVAVLGGDPVPMTEQERKDWGGIYQFTKATDDQAKAYEEKQQAAAKAEGDDSPVVATRLDQQRLQAEAAGAQGPSAATSQVSRPQASSQSSRRSSKSESSETSKGSQGDKETTGSSGGTQGNKS